jgi:CheY-like chemotaxis protein
MISILIIDDAAFSRRMLRKYIEAEGYTVLEATNGKEAIEMVQEHQPDCILTDLLMPEMDGFQLIQALRAKNCEIPVAVISADIQDTSRQRAGDLGAVEFLNKPAKEAEVRQMIQQLLEPQGSHK